MQASVTVTGWRGERLSSTPGSTLIASPATILAGFCLVTSIACLSRVRADVSGGAHACSQASAVGSPGSIGLSSIPAR
jgi:hypothetical protein